MLLGSFSHDLRAQRDEQRVATDACGYASAMCDSRVCVSAVRGLLASSQDRIYVTGDALCTIGLDAERPSRHAS